jgi:uncharacterized membrane protein YidH (DUF202 family)
VSGDQPDSRSARPDDRTGDALDAEPGLAQERTDLAWTRDSISFLALGIAILKFRPVVGIPVLAIGLVAWLAGRLSRTGGREPMASRRVLLVTLAVNSLAVVALALTLAGPSSHGLRP